MNLDRNKKVSFISFSKYGNALTLRIRNNFQKMLNFLKDKVLEVIISRFFVVI